MDEQTEGFLKVIGYMMIAPFWITWKVSQFLWQLVFKPAIEDANHKRAQQLASKSPPAAESSIASTVVLTAALGFFLILGIADRNPLFLGGALVGAVVLILFELKPTKPSTPPQPEQAQPRDLLREKQLAGLRGSLPPGLPDRMRATIQINETRLPRLKQERVRHLIGEDSFVNVEAGETTKYAVDMILQMTEAERSIVKQHQLDDIVLEDIPYYTEDELLTQHFNAKERERAAKDPLYKAIEGQMIDIVDKQLKSERRKTRVGDLLVSPFSRTFEIPHEANDYAHKLKTEFLPKIRQLLDRYRDYKQTETIEF